uniref:Histone acetyltransferase n=1 Tax=Meloidogyne javanica TaxID=6303 RepID=A0A915MA50_MELJA
MMAKVWGVNGGGGATAPISAFSSAFVPPMHNNMPLKKSPTNLHVQALTSGKSFPAAQSKHSFDNPKFAMKHKNAQMLDLGETIGEEEKNKEVVANQEKDIRLLNGAETLPIASRRLLLEPNRLKAFELSKEPLKSFYQANEEMIIRHAVPEDATQMRQIAISLINSENVKPEIEVDQIEKDLQEGFVHALVIEIKEEKKIIGYLSYTISSSLNGGKVVYLGDLICEIKYKDLPVKLYGELAKKSTIYLPGKLSGDEAIYLIKQWKEMNGEDESTSNLTNLLRTGQVGAVTVHLDVRPSVVSMLFFHGNYYSLWDGQSIWVDKMSFSPLHFDCHIPNAISAMFGKLVELSNAIEAKRIGWIFNEETRKNFYEIMENIGAINMTKQEDWHIYRSNKSEFSEYLTTTGDNYMKLNGTHKQRANDLLKKQKAREIKKIQHE